MTHREGLRAHFPSSVQTRRSWQDRVHRLGGARPMRAHHHLLERPPRLRGAGLLFIRGHKLVAARAHDALDGGPLGFARLLVGADAEVSGARHLV